MNQSPVSGRIAATVGRVVPLLFVDEIERSLRFYVQQLGFHLTESWAPREAIEWCRIERGGAELMLQQMCDEDRFASPRGDGVVFYIHCDSADALYEELSSRGLTVQPPETAFYGMRQLCLTDSDGYSLCFQNPVTTEST